jgi:hypothetical protein
MAVPSTVVPICRATSSSAGVQVIAAPVASGHEGRLGVAGTHATFRVVPALDAVGVTCTSLGVEPGIASRVGAAAAAVDPCPESEQKYSYEAESPATVAAQQLYGVSGARPLTVTGVSGSEAGADKGNHVPFGSHSDANEHWNAYPATGRALPLGPVGATAATSND